MSDPLSFAISLEQEDFCLVTDSVRRGIPVRVEILDSAGRTVHEAGVEPSAPPVTAPA